MFSISPSSSPSSLFGFCVLLALLLVFQFGPTVGDNNPANNSPSSTEPAKQVGDGDKDKLKANGTDTPTPNPSTNPNTNSTTTNGTVTPAGEGDKTDKPKPGPGPDQPPKDKPSSGGFGAGSIFSKSHLLKNYYQYLNTKFKSKFKCDKLIWIKKVQICVL